jgi:hypothetical protein
MNLHLNTRIVRVLGWATLALLSGCETYGVSYGVSTGYYGGSVWNDPYYYRPCCYGGVVVRPPPHYRPPHGGGRPPPSYQPGRPANLPYIPSRPSPMPSPATRR